MPVRGDRCQPRCSATRALDRGLDIVECPITFYPRVGVSKGGNVNNLRALAVGLRMIRGIVFGWPSRTRGGRPLAKPSAVLQ